MIYDGYLHVYFIFWSWNFWNGWKKWIIRQTDTCMHTDSSAHMYTITC